MTISAGTHLGPFEVVDLLGAGGMGAVYRAYDPRLRRDVAIKVLPPAFARDPDRLASIRTGSAARSRASRTPTSSRSTTSARTRTRPSSSPNCSKGKRCARRSNGRPLPARQGLDYAVQIARGLAAAHERGIVHRDIKPENLFVTQGWPGQDPRLRPREAHRSRCGDRRDSAATLTVDGPGPSERPRTCRRNRRAAMRDRPRVGPVQPRGRALRDAVGHLTVPPRHRRRNDDGDSSRRSAGARRGSLPLSSRLAPHRSSTAWRRIRRSDSRAPAISSSISSRCGHPPAPPACRSPREVLESRQRWRSLAAGALATRGRARVRDRAPHGRRRRRRIASRAMYRLTDFTGARGVSGDRAGREVGGVHRARERCRADLRPSARGRHSAADHQGRARSRAAALVAGCELGRLLLACGARRHSGNDLADSCARWGATPDHRQRRRR